MRADLHLHSRHSSRAPEWVLRQAGIPDSASAPRALYDTLRARGMDFVTLTDHDSIAGCLEIADRPGVFISEQVTARFPEDRAVVHLLVWGISEAQHAEIQRARDNVFDLQGYLAAEKIAHAVAHPFYRTDPRLGVGHLEKLILLFRHFEGVNGLRDGLHNAALRFALERLTPERIEAFANRHHLAPTHVEPWKKVLVGGSDDHSATHPGSAWTETPAAGGVGEFLDHVRAGRCTAGGADGSPLTHAHALYGNLGAFLLEKLSAAGGSPLLTKALSRFMEGKDPTEFSFADKLGFLGHGILTGQIFELAKPANASLWRQLSQTFSQAELKDQIARVTDGVAEPERRAFALANLFVSQLVFRFFTRFVQRVSSGNVIEAVQEAAMLLPLGTTLAPYFYALKTESPDRRWLTDATLALAGEAAPELRRVKRAWFTDTLDDVNGVATTIKKMSAACAAQGAEIEVITSRAGLKVAGFPVKNFEPVGEFELPEYKLQKLSFPPVLPMLDYIQRGGFTELIISTPGPVGLVALLAGKMLGLRTVGIYHTDFPQYVRILSDDAAMETLTWAFMRGFFAAMDRIYVNSESYRSALAAQGFAPEKLALLPRGLDTALFHPSQREDDFWTRRGAPEGRLVALYVGRISREKDLEVIAQAAGEIPATLAFVGDGPFRDELARRLPGAVFTGVLQGVELARAYASADVFLFPSTTDTFGNVILEALASGLPCVVSDQGGPQDLITDCKTGAITRALDAADFAAACRSLLADMERLRAMRLAARSSVENRDWAEAARRFMAV